MSPSSDGAGKAWACNVCGKTNKDKTKMKRHVETHVEGFIHPCPFCRKQNKSRESLRQHVANYHTEGKGFLNPFLKNK
jgi:hypothetical protein